MKVFEWIERQLVEWASGRRGNIIRARSLTNWNRFHFYEPRVAIVRETLHDLRSKLTAAESRIAELTKANKEAEEEFIKENAKVRALLSTLRWAVERCEEWINRCTAADNPNEWQEALLAAAKELLPPLRQALEPKGAGQ